MQVLSFLFGVATGIILMVVLVAIAAALVGRRFKRHPELIGRFIARKAVRPTLKKVS